VNYLPSVASNRDPPDLCSICLFNVATGSKMPKACDCSPSYSGGLNGRITWVQELETSLGNAGRPSLLKNKRKEKKG
jgi:hypothetical protein